MHVTCPTSALALGVKACAPAISGKPAMPILAGVLITAGDETDTVTLRGFDYEVEVTTRVNARVEASGVALVSHRLLSQILAVCTAPTVNLTVEDGRLTVAAGKAVWRLPLMTADAFPASPGPLPTVGTVDTQAFTDAVERVAPAASDKVSIDIPLHAIYLGFGDTLDVVATDKYRLHTALIPWDRTATDSPEFVLTPAAKLLAVVKGLTGDTVTLGASDNRLSLTDGTTVVTTALSTSRGGGWVQWRPLFDGINPDTGVTYVFDRDDLTTAIKQAVTVADVTDTGARHLILTVTTEEMLVRAVSDHSGNSAVPCPVADYTGAEPLEWTVAADFLLAAIVAADTDPVQFTQKSAKMPVGIGAPKEPATQIAMPIRKVS